MSLQPFSFGVSHPACVKCRKVAAPIHWEPKWHKPEQLKWRCPCDFTEFVTAPADAVTAPQDALVQRGEGEEDESSVPHDANGEPCPDYRMQHEYFRETVKPAPSDDREALGRVAYEAFYAWDKCRRPWAELNEVSHGWWNDTALAVAAAVRKREGQGVLDQVIAALQEQKYGDGQPLTDAERCWNMTFDAAIQTVKNLRPAPADRGEEAIYELRKACGMALIPDGLAERVIALYKAFEAFHYGKQAANQAALALAEKGEVKG